ncbi:DMT family transporter [bacterium]|nr:DMT family transporter [candidate division CSSED10-310 bacterium]
MTNVDRRVHLVLLFVQVMFGVFHVVAKSVLTHVDPLAVAAIRVVGAAPILITAGLLIDRTLPRLKDLPYLALLGILGVWFNQLLFIVGLQHTTATNAAIMMPSVPVFAAAIGLVTGIERMTSRRLAGILICVTGALVMLNVSQLNTGHRVGWGNTLILLNCLSFSLFLVLQRPLLRRLPPVTVTAWAFLFGGLGMLAVTFRHLAALSPAALPGSVLARLAFIVLVPTSLNYVLNSWAVARSTPSLVAAYITIQPVVSASVAAMVLGERAGIREALGFAMIAGGLFLVSRNGAAGQRAGRAPVT